MTEKNKLSTFDRLMQNPARKEQFDEKYRGFVLVEVLIPLLEKSNFSVRELAKNAHLSPTVIQDIKSGKKDSISFSTFLSILQALGYSAVLEVSKEKASRQRHQLLKTPRRSRSPVQRPRRKIKTFR